MCQLFVGADHHLWESHTKSLRIDGVVTSIRLEAFFWETLEEIAFRDEMTVTQLFTKLYFESMDADHDIGNFTSFLRVCCSRYLSLAADGKLSRSEITAIADVDANKLLRQEAIDRKTRNSRFSPAGNKGFSQH